MDLRSVIKENETKSQNVTTSNSMEKVVTNPIEGLPTLTDLDGDFVMSQYFDFLKKHNISRTDVFSVLDAFITNGNVVWSFDLFNKIKVKLHVRPSWAIEYVSNIMDKYLEDNPKATIITYNNVMAKYNLAASLSYYKDKEYNIINKETLEQAIKDIEDLPYPVMSALVDKLAAFDRLVAVATSDWTIKNFTKPQQEEQKQNS